MTVAAIEAAIAEPGAGNVRPPGDRRAAAPAGRLGRRSSSADEAAVALVFAGRDGDLRLCFIRRATHPRDPWSGQMALPGGRATPADASLCAAAVRETHEEVGLSLARARYLGALPPIALVRHGRPTTGSVAPFVFYAGGALPALTVRSGGSRRRLLDRRAPPARPGSARRDAGDRGRRHAAAAGGPLRAPPDMGHDLPYRHRTAGRRGAGVTGAAAAGQACDAGGRGWMGCTGARA